MNPSLLLFGLFLLLLICNMPVAMALATASLATCVFIEVPISLLPQVLFTSLDNFPILAVPFFILAGALMSETGMCERILDFADSIVGHIKGGLAMVCVVSAMIFASISGAGVAATAAIGSILIPAMINRGYRKNEAAAIQATSGAIGVIIPPSIPMIIFGAVASMSVARLFLGGILPGVLVGLAIMTTAYFSAVKHNYPVEKKFEIKRVFVTFKKALLPLGMPVIILGGIFGGIFTPTEAAIVAVAYVMIIAVIQRSITFKNIPDMFMDVAVLSSVATFLVAGASLFAWVLASEQIPQKIATSLLETLQNKYLILLAINVLLLFVGTFLENISAIIILAPILMPIGEKLGMDPYHMAVIICFNLATGMATPPVGANLFVAGAIANTNLTQTSKGTIPYLIAMIIVLLLVTYIPAITVFLPNMFIPLK